MTSGNNDNRRGWRGLDKTGLIGGAVIGALIIVLAIYSVGISHNTASSPGGDSQATGTGPTSPSGAPSKGTTGSGSPGR
jgi:hypothetical protein